MVAAFCNLTVGFLVFLYLRAVGGGTGETGIREESLSRAHGENLGMRSRFAMILLLACCVGYLSLSQEIVWFRVLSYATGGKPDVFPHVVGFVLLGIAYGARDTKKFYKKERTASLAFVATALCLSSFLFYVSIPLIAEIGTFMGLLANFTSYLAVLLVAFAAGGIFPAVCHYGIESGAAVGLSLSFVYGANIAGSAIGPLLTGFVLLERFPLDRLILYLSMGGLLLAAFVWAASAVSKAAKVQLLFALACVATGICVFHPGLYAQVLEKLHYQTDYAGKRPYKHVIENRNGIVAVEAGASDIVYGGGVYDGTFNVDPVFNSNNIRRAYMLAALHRSPEDVLQIGLSSGSWARVVAAHNAVKTLTIIEINPAYEKLLRHYPDAAAILTDPRVTIHYDDGRRWLRRNPDRQFDVILMNTTFHWRDMTTNLLSDEFLRLCKSHLKKGGMVYYNTTFSEDAVFTAAQVFQHVATYMNFVAASDWPFSLSPSERRLSLMQFQNAGRPVFAAADTQLAEVLDELARSETADRGDELRNRKDLWHITDDNMAPEFKRRYFSRSSK
jgi:spermidine synthase